MDQTPPTETETPVDQTPTTVPDFPPKPERSKPQPWTKKKKTIKPKKSKRHGITGRKWSWGHFNTFQPVSKWTKEGRLVRPTLRTTIPGCIYYAMKRIQRGTDKTVVAAAIEEGLLDLSVQDPLTRVQTELRLLARLGVIKRTKPIKGKKRERTYR